MISSIYRCKGFLTKFSLQCCMQLARPKAEGWTWKQTKAQKIFFFFFFFSLLVLWAIEVGVSVISWVVVWKISICTEKFCDVCHQLTEVVANHIKGEIWRGILMVLWCPCRYRKDVAIYLLFFIISSDLYRRIYPFLLLFDIKCYIYFGDPVSTRFRSILLPHGIRLVRTCWFFSRLR